MVRVWSPGNGETAGGLRGTARHVSSGASTIFTDAHQLISFLTATVAAGDDGQPPVVASIHGTQPQPAEED